MENASKALIMAGSILIALVVISLGVIAFNNFKNNQTERQMDKQEVSIFNSKLSPYAGNNISGSQVRALANKVNAINRAAISDGNNRTVNMYLGDSTNVLVGMNDDGNDVETNIGNIQTNAYYNVTCNNGDGGFINEIIVVEVAP